MPSRIDLTQGLFRFEIFLVVMSSVVAFLYGIGALQTFLDSSLETLYLIAQTLSWIGILSTILYSFLEAKRKPVRKTRFVLNLVFSAYFVVFFLLLQFLGAWFYT